MILGPSGAPQRARLQYRKHFPPKADPLEDAAEEGGAAADSLHEGVNVVVETAADAEEAT